MSYVKNCEGKSCDIHIEERPFCLLGSPILPRVRVDAFQVFISAIFCFSRELYYQAERIPMSHRLCSKSTNIIYIDTGIRVIICLSLCECIPPRFFYLSFSTLALY